MFMSREIFIEKSVILANRQESVSKGFDYKQKAAELQSSERRFCFALIKRCVYASGGKRSGKFNRTVDIIDNRFFFISAYCKNSGGENFQVDSLTEDK